MNVPIQMLDNETAGYLMADISDEVRTYVQDTVKELRGSQPSKKIPALILIGIFVLAVVLMIVFSKVLHNGTATAMVFFGLFLCFSVIALFDKGSRSQSRGIFFFGGLGLGGLLTCICKLTVPALADIHLIAILVPSGFIFVGISMLLSLFSGFGFTFRKFDKMVTAECIGYQYEIHKILVCAPVYKYRYDNVEYTAYDQDAMRSDAVTVKIGDVRNIYIDSTDPYYFSQKASGISNGFLAGIAIFCIILGLAVAYMVYTQRNTEAAGRENVEMIMNDGRIVLTEELVTADRTALYNQDVKIISIVRCIFIAGTVFGVYLFVLAIRYSLLSKKIEEEGGRPQQKGMFIMVALFVLAFCGVVTFCCTMSINDSMKDINEPIDIVEYNIVDKYYTSDWDPASETYDYDFFLTTDDGKDLKVSQSVFDYVTMTGTYYMSETNGHINRAYYYREYTIES